MITIPLYFKHNEEIRKHQEQYSLMFRKCHANKEFKKLILEEFDFYDAEIYEEDQPKSFEAELVADIMSSFAATLHRRRKRQSKEYRKTLEQEGVSI